MSQKKIIAAVLGIHVIIGGIAHAQVPKLGLEAVLETNRDFIHILPNDRVISTCTDALRSPLSEEDESEIRMRRGWALYGLKKYAEAKGDFDWVVERFPNRMDARRDRALCSSLLDGNSAWAMQEWQDIIKRDPEFIGAYASLAQAYMAGDQHSEAISIATQGLERDPTNAGLLWSRANAYLKLRDYNSCLRDVNQTLSMECFDFASPIPSLYAVRGSALLGLKQYEAAARSFMAAIRIDPKPVYKTGLCIAFCNLRRTGLAHLIAQELDKSPEAHSDPDAIRACAVAFFKGRDFERGSHYAELWLSQAPGDYRPIELAGLAALGCQDYQAARRHLGKALEVNPLAEGALGGMALLLAFDPDGSQRDVARALDHAQQLCEITKKQPARALAILGLIRLVNGDHMSAADSFRRCLESAGDLSPERRAVAERTLQILQKSQEVQDLRTAFMDARVFVL